MGLVSMKVDGKPVKVKRCHHKEADSLKPGPSTTQVMNCKVCGKIIVKGKQPPTKNGCFGRSKYGV